MLSRWTRKNVNNFALRARTRLLCQALERRDTPATFTVSNLNDSGAGSLRAAIASANANSGADLNTFGVNGMITLTSGQLNISDPLTILGLGSSKLTVSGNKVGRAFTTTIAPSGANIVLYGMTITEGRAGAPSSAIFVNDEALSIDSCVVTDNAMVADMTFPFESRPGGAIYVQSATGSLNVQNSTVSGNGAGTTSGYLPYDDGGGIAIAAASKVTISVSTFTYNYDDSGGGIFFGFGGSLIEQNSTFDNNNWSAIHFEGAIGAGGFVVRNSTIAENYGVGIYLNANATIETSVQNSTIARNYNAGIYVLNGKVALESNIAASNNTELFGFDDITRVGTVTAKNCAIGSPQYFTLTDLGGNLPFNPHLPIGYLHENGGPTQTCALAPGNPCINKGSNPNGLTTDQHGQNRVWDGHIDIGAYEAPPDFVVKNANKAGPSSLRQTILDANTIAGANTISFDPTVFSTAKFITLSSGELSITDALTITGPGASFATISGNSASRVMNLSGAPTGTVVVLSGLTLASGKSAGAGGALFVGDESLTLNDSIVTGSGGVARFGGVAAIAIESSVISGNTNVNAPDVFSTGVVYLKNIAIGSNIGFAATDQGGNLANQPIANLLLGILNNNGGPTMTMLPADKSPLSGHGSNPTGMVVDQRGAGFPRSVNGVVDIGAVQVNDLVVHNTANAGTGTLRQVIATADHLPVSTPSPLIRRCSIRFGPLPLSVN